MQENNVTSKALTPSLVLYATLFENWQTLMLRIAPASIHMAPPEFCEVKDGVLMLVLDDGFMNNGTFTVTPGYLYSPLCHLSY